MDPKKVLDYFHLELVKIELAIAQIKGLDPQLCPFMMDTISSLEQSAAKVRGTMATLYEMVPKHRGRPPKWLEKARRQVDLQVLCQGKRRGRPPGSKNKPQGGAIVANIAHVVAKTPVTVLE